MIQIEYQEKEMVEKCHLAYVRKRIKMNVADFERKCVDKSISLEKLRQFFGFGQEDTIIQKIAVSPDLDELARLQEEWFQQIGMEHKDALAEALQKLLDYDHFYEGLIIQREQKSVKWNRHKLLTYTNVRVCPYCGRQYITLSDKTITASCDHYYPKGKFPLLSINMYNLIPCCHICNSVFKGDKVREKQEFHLYPYADGTDSLKFRVAIENADNLYNLSEKANYIKVEITDINDLERKQRAENSRTLFHLQELYQFHAKDAYELRRALREEGNRQYQEIFKANFKQLSAINNYAFLYRTVEIQKEPLVKFRRDIEEQFRDAQSL